MTGATGPSLLTPGRAAIVRREPLSDPAGERLTDVAAARATA